MTTEQIRSKLLVLHNQENELNKQICNHDKAIKGHRKEILKLAKRVSANMKYRNTLIEKL